MVGEQSLQDILNIVAARPADDALFTKNAKRTIDAGSAFTELDAFVALDPLLASMQKQYRDAKAQRLQTIQEFGADDPMTEMAVWAEDSAWCAMQTRYMEVRDDRALMREAQKMMMEREEEAQESERILLEKQRTDVFLRLQIIHRLQEAENKTKDTGWWWLFYLLVIQQPDPMQSRNYPTHHFNRLAA